MGIGYFELMIILVMCSFPALLAFIDIIRSDFAGNNKLFWLLAVALFPLVGSLAYFVLGKKQKLS
ncbi:MAG: PLD nuclease N-terminal domain-containing protein [Geobacteraceae bacterium]|nr:PLD nuclease N-terminal domain-containing protein [Geobacteraceae bacterium]